MIDHLLEDGRIHIAGVSGTSAGAMNAVMLADGLARGGGEEARKRLAEFWRAASIGGNLPGPQRAVLDRLLALMPVEASPVRFMVDTMSRVLSPYDLNPLNINPLKGLIERFVDFDAIRAFKDLDIFISATNVHSGRLRVFKREEMSADVVMASAALPLVFRAVEIDGEPYWDGGFTGNPAILPLIEANEIDDVLVVQISPLSRNVTPTSAREIMHGSTRSRSIPRSIPNCARSNISAALPSKRGKKDAAHAANVKVHRIVLDGAGKLGAGTGLSADYDFFALLHRAGRRAARRFLDAHFRDIGRRSTLDLTEDFAASA